MFQAQSPNELIALLLPTIANTDLADRYRISEEFYTADNILPRIAFIENNWLNIISKPEYHEESYDWIFNVLFAIKNALLKAKIPEHSARFKKFTDYYISNYVQDEKCETDYGFDYGYDLALIAAELTIQHLIGNISKEIVQLWSKIAPEKLIDDLIFPNNILYLDVYDGEEQKSLLFHVPEPEFIKAYIEVIRLLKNEGIQVHKLYRHIMACLKFIVDNVHYFSLEDAPKYLLYIEKLKSVCKDIDVPEELFTLCRFVCEVYIYTNNEEQEFSTMKLPKKKIEEILVAVNESYLWCSKYGFYSLINEYWDCIALTENEDHLPLLVDFYKRALVMDKEIQKREFDIIYHSKDLLLEKDQFQLIVDLYEKDLHEDDFDVAYSYKQLNQPDKAKNIYLKIIENGKASSSVYNNLAVIYEEQKEWKMASDYFNQALKMEPNSELYKRNKKRIDDIVKKQKQTKMEISDIYFKKTNKWQKSLLFAIYRLYGQEPTVEDYAHATSQKPEFVERNLILMTNLGLIKVDHEDEYVLEETIQKLVADYIDPKLERQIIKVDRAKLYRPIFFHESEINLYRVLVELFPQHLVFPNMSLKTIFDVEKLKELLSSEHMNYLYMAHVDFAIVSTSSYTPVIAFEKDSSYHDGIASKKRDEQKNNIFKMGGVPLIRIRFHSGMTREKLKHQIREATKEMILELQHEHQEGHRLFEEVDVRKFGVSLGSELDLDSVQESWYQIVGVGIAQKSKIQDIEEGTVRISISNDLESIIGISGGQLFDALQKAHPQLKQVEYLYY